MKKNFKTFVIGLAAIVGTMTLVGCGGEKENESNSIEVSTTSAIETTTATATATTTAITIATTIETTEISTESIATSTTKTIEDAFAALEKDLVITNKEQQFANLIGAKDGYSFNCNGLTFELYIYENEAAELEDAADGSLSYELYEGYIVEMNTYINKNFVLVCYEEDVNVINAFMAF